MNIDILELYNNSPEEVKIIIIVGVVFLSYKGVIKIPWIPIGNKCKDFTKKVWFIRSIETLYEQMNIFEVAHSSIMFSLKKAYLELTTNENDNQHYELITQEAQKECKGNIRKWLKENHFSSRTQTEWEVYKKEKINLLLEIVTYHFDLKYKDTYFKISRSKLSEKNKQVVVPVAIEKWNKAFDDCREVSIKNELKIKDLEGDK